ncbi:MAG TPA: hypothetical protein VJL83_03490 [Patescibacteria group bacterium]|nr:hypothetical protein [Patescibacteria group bacterium]
MSNIGKEGINSADRTTENPLAYGGTETTAYDQPAAVKPEENSLAPNKGSRATDYVNYWAETTGVSEDVRMQALRAVVTPYGGADAADAIIADAAKKISS